MICLHILSSSEMEDTSTPNRRRLISELIRGRDCTKQLQNLFHHTLVDDEPVSAEDLVMKIIGSFSDSLSTFNPWCTGELSPAATTHVGSANYASSSGVREKKQEAAVKEPRGCYKRKKTDDSRVTIAKTYEDGYAWRKYGQKDIQHAKFPRCYYRCTHKDDRGCKALKHVQELEDGSRLFRITYFGSHTCQNVNKSSQMFSDSDDLGFFLINFEDSGVKHSTSSLSTSPNVQTTSSFNQGNDLNAQSGDYLASSNHGTSSMYVWEDMLSNFEDCLVKHSSVSSLLSITNAQTTTSFNQENDSKAQSGDYLASSHDTSSMCVWEDMLAKLDGAIL